MPTRGLDHHNHENKDDEAKVSPVFEEYLESILNMTSEGKPAIGARLAERMNVKPATVVGAIERLKDKGYVVVDDKSKGVNLTDNLPANVFLSSVPSPTNTCGGTLTASPNASQLTLTGGTVPARPAASQDSNCVVTVRVTSAVVGVKTKPERPRP